MTEGPTAAWFAMRDAPMWVCAGGPLDGTAIHTSQRAGVYRTRECAEAGGYYVLAHKPEGRFTVPTATWRPDEAGTEQTDGSNEGEAG